MERALHAVQTVRTAAETATFFRPLLYLESLGITSIKIQLQMKVSIADDLWFPVAAAFLQTALS